MNSVGAVIVVEETHTVLSLRGEIDLANVAELEDACDQVPTDRGVIVDANLLDFIDCSAVGVLARLVDRFPAGMVVARGASRIQKMLLEMATAIDVGERSYHLTPLRERQRRLAGLEVLSFRTQGRVRRAG